MKELDQFITWRFEPNPGKKKPKKVPFDHRTGKRSKPTDPATWLAYAEAVATGHSLGFVFTADDPYFFVDLDNCRDGDNWNAAALAMLARFPGAEIEASVSGKGLHIFGRYTGSRPEHGCKSGGWLELYTADRFVAIGSNQVGDSNTDHTAALNALIVSHFPVKYDTVNADWTTEPVEAWTGPTDDDELIRKARRTESLSVTFGKTCSFEALWTADETQLSVFFPDSDRAYDGNSSDLALAKHLAYWTGDNCERIERLMRASGLNRDKYDRPDYIPRTLARAIGGKVYDYVKPAPVATDAPIAGPGAYAFLTIPDQEEFFKGCIYVITMNKVMMPSGLLLGKDQFCATIPCHEFARDTTGAAKTTRSPWEAFNQSLGFRQPLATFTCFDPLEPWDAPLEIAGCTYANTYRPIDTPRKAGDATPFLRHIATLLPDQRDQQILLSYMAAVVQYKGTKFHWTVVIQGAPGNGKSLITSVLQAALGEHYGTASGSDLASRFNGWIIDKILIGIADVQLSTLAAEVLKPMLSDKSISVQSKGVDQKTLRSCVNFVFTTNSRDAIPKTRDERRYSVFYTAQQTADDIDVQAVSDLYDWLEVDGYAIVHDWLATWQIPDEFNPATTCKRAPDTSTTDEVIASSIGPLEQELLDFIDEGRAGFRGGWVSRTVLSALCEHRNPRPKVTQHREILARLGYEPHRATVTPRRKCGRTNTAVRPDGLQAELWVLKTHPDAQLATNAEAAGAYEKANEFKDG